MINISIQRNFVIAKIILTVTVVSAMIALLAGIWEYLLPMYLIYKYDGSSSINIREADGPTTIFVSTKLSDSLSITLIFFVITIMGIIAMIFMKKISNKMKPN